MLIFPKMTSGTVVVLITVLLASVVVGTGLWGRYLAQPGPLAAPATVLIEAGQGPKALAKALAQAQVIAHPHAFVLAVRLLGLDRTLKAGAYQFEPRISLRAVINKLALGETESRSVMIPEGWTVRQVLERLEATEGLTGKATAVGEGSIFPDTYHFRFGVERDKLLETMTSRMAQELAAAWAARTPNLPLNTPEDLLNLASIVQKEAATEAEMPMIAAVFINRLRQGMKLQADPTVIYGAAFDGNLRKKDLTEAHPFNTYMYAGLPPTPIANPGRAALRAVANPASTDALFFMADPSRTLHVFAKTYAEHQKNVARYWALVGAQGGKEVRISGTVARMMLSDTVPLLVQPKK